MDLTADISICETFVTIKSPLTKQKVEENFGNFI